MFVFDYVLIIINIVAVVIVVIVVIIVIIVGVQVRLEGGKALEINNNVFSVGVTTLISFSFISNKEYFMTPLPVLTTTLIFLFCFTSILFCNMKVWYHPMTDYLWHCLDEIISFVIIIIIIFTIVIFLGIVIRCTC